MAPDRRELVRDFERGGQELEAVTPLMPRQLAKILPGEEWQVEDDKPKVVSMDLRPVEGSHRGGESSGDELTVQDGPVPQVRELLGEKSEATGERRISLPVSSLTAPVPRLNRPIVKDDQPTDAIDLRLDRPSSRSGDCCFKDAETVFATR
jgi:hypothetical protein